MKKRLLLLIATLVLVALCSSLVSRGASTTVFGYEMRPVAYLELEGEFNPDDYVVLDCCLEVPNQYCELLQEDFGCKLIP